MNYLVYGINNNSYIGTNKKVLEKPLKPENFANENLLNFESNRLFSAALHENGTVSVKYNKKKAKLKLDSPITQISLGSWGHMAFLTQDQRVYTYGDNNGFGQLGTGSQSIKATDPYEVVELRDKNIIEILSCQITTYARSQNGDLYFWGHVRDGNNVEKPELIEKNVETIMGGYSWHTFMIQTDGTFLGRGDNKTGQLGNGQITNHIRKTIKLNPPFDASTIIDWGLSNDGSLILTNEGILYFSGTISPHNSNTFKDIEFFKGKNPVSVSCCEDRGIVLTDNQDLYLFGNAYQQNIWFPNHSLVGENIYKLTTNVENRIGSIYFGYHKDIFFKLETNFLVQDLSDLFEKKYETDQSIHGIEVHRVMLENRLDRNFDDIKKILQGNFTKEETFDIMKWVYKEKFLSQKITEKLKQYFENLNTIDLHKKSIKNDFLKLYKDEDSKDFKILVPIDDDDDDDEDDDDEDAFEEIPVHKFILLARSGLFREMFKNVTEESKFVKDFSSKTIESLEILIKYLYTDKIELTADDDPELVVEELSDAKEYYQLNKHSNLNLELRKIKEQFRLN
ncbi:btk-binding protein-related [Anaeramoeba flamelloides]|uniref:Btk-binding protein-related n=1 Tax=Anaeramoeba flamelloides TaxID=1746091 RepID=A0ABQ8XCQ4_9EUKA|nr:btk-binding protein-related [Anaeramoeba flamelloides]